MAKDPFKGLDEEFKDSVNNMTEAEMRDTIARVSLNQLALMEAKENDTDLAAKKEEYSVAGAGYREATKMNKMRNAFLRQALGDKSKENGTFDKGEAQEAADEAADRAEDGED